MPNKRFLGLGFTFSATDKGLEKKLIGIQNALAGITSSLGSINSGAATAGAKLGKMKSPPRLRLVSPKPNSTSSNKTSTPTSPHLKSGTSEELSRLFPDVKTFFESTKKAIFDNYGSQTLKAFEKQIDRVRFYTDESGKLISSSSAKVFELTEELGKAFVSFSGFVKLFGNLKTVFEWVKGWVTETKNAIDHLFQSFGVDFGKMIPEQFKALYGVLDSFLIKPLRNFSSYLLSSFTKMFFKSNTEKVLKNVYDSIGKASPGNSVVQSLIAIKKNTIKEGEQGNPFVNFFAPLLAPLALVVGGLIGFAESLVVTKKLIGKTSLFTKIGEGFTAVKEALLGLKWVQKIGTFFESIGTKLKSLSVISKLFEGLGKGFEWLMGIIELFAMNPVFKWFFNLGKVWGARANILFLVADAFYQLYKAYNETSGVFNILTLAMYKFLDSLTFGYLTKTVDKVKDVVFGTRDNDAILNNLKTKLAQSTANDHIYSMANPLDIQPDLSSLSDMNANNNGNAKTQDLLEQHILVSKDILERQTQALDEQRKVKPIFTNIKIKGDSVGDAYKAEMQTSYGAANQ